MTRTPNRYELLPSGVARIALTRDQVTLVDARDLPLLLSYRWCAKAYPNDGQYRAVTSVEGKIVKMSTLLLGVKGGDHVNRNPLDNRRANLRRATQSQNLANRAHYGKQSRYKGVHPHRQKWFARVSKDGRHYRSPSLTTQEDAARWYNAKARELFGDFAHLNALGHI
jgi:hypothetical protein